MPAVLSVIIPTRNAAHIIGPTLACLCPKRGQSILHEIIIVDGGSGDAIAEVAIENNITFCTSAQGRGPQLRKGAELAQGDWLLFLHADTVLPQNWVDVIHAHIQTEPKAGYCKLSFDVKGFAPKCLAMIANLRARFLQLPYGDQGLLISKTLYNSVGGYPNLPLMEDVALARKLRGKLKLLPLTATTRADRYLTGGWVCRPLKNLKLLILYFLGVSPKRLAKWYAQ